MSDLIASVSAAIDIAKRLRQVGENIRDAEIQNLVADLSLELAEAKMKLSAVLEENVALKAKVRELETSEADPCPKCRRRGWQLEDSRPDTVFGDVGGFRRIYTCSLCGFSEERLETPS